MTLQTGVHILQSNHICHNNSYLPSTPGRIRGSDLFRRFLSNSSLSTELEIYIDTYQIHTTFRCTHIPFILLNQNVSPKILNYFRHIQIHQTLEKLILEGKVKGRRNRGRSNRCWEKDVEDWMRASVWREGRTADD